MSSLESSKRSQKRLLMARNIASNNENPTRVPGTGSSF